MSELDDEDGDSIDWNEAIETLNAVETARAAQKAITAVEEEGQSRVSSISTSKRRASNNDNHNDTVDFASPSEEDILFLYDLIDTSQYILVNDDGQDIEDTGGMKQSFKPAARTLFDQFR